MLVTTLKPCLSSTLSSRREFKENKLKFCKENTVLLVVGRARKGVKFWQP